MEPLDQTQGDRPSPPILPFFLFLILAALTGALVGSGIAVGVGYLMGLDLGDMMSTAEDTFRMRTFLRVSNLISHLLTFTVPALVLTAVFYRRRTWSFLQLNRSPRLDLLGLGIVWVLVCFPFAQLLYWLNRRLPLPDSLLSMEESATRLLEILMHMNSPGELLLNILVVGVAPAIGEELIFRGVIQKRLQEKLSPVAAVWITAFIFSTIHLQFAGFLPRFLLGALLGYLFYWSRNLWVPIAAHFLFNTSQVIGQYLYGEELSQLELEGPAEPSWAGGLLSLSIMVALGIYFYRRSRTEPHPG